VARRLLEPASIRTVLSSVLACALVASSEAGAWPEIGTRNDTELARPTVGRGKNLQGTIRETPGDGAQQLCLGRHARAGSG
jgi:hypothetical protein